MKTIRQYVQTLVRWLVTAAVLGLSFACTHKAAPEQPAPPKAVAFDAYLGRGVTTRAGTGGIIDNTTLRTAGFGVFGYYTQGTPYNYEIEPNFMYNVGVTNISGASWDYAPIKYWPNESGEGSGDGPSDMISFFAYAPYVNADPVSGGVTGDVDKIRGIIQFTNFIDKNDPKITYKATCYPSRSVDLCWALPQLNMERPAVATPVFFQFHHALSALNLQIDGAFDELTPGSNGPASETRVYVRYVTFEGFAIQGVLNLNNSSTTPDWTSLTGLTLSRDAVTVHDGRMDGLEARYADELETPIGLNAGIIQEQNYNFRPGVTNSLRNLFDTNAPSAPVFVIPNGYPFSVTIEYDVETRDDKLASSYLADGTTHGSVTTVRVRQVIDSGGEPIRLEAGKKYVIRMHLGMTSVKFEAGMTDEWAEDNEIIVLHPVTMGQEVVVHTTADEGWS